MPGRAFVEVRDYSNEIGITKLNSVNITAGNFTAQGGLLTALVAAIDPITRGAMAGSKIQIPTNGGNIAPSLEEAQIETTWLILYTDDQPFLDPGTDLVPNPGYGLPFQLNWPCATYTDFLLPGSDDADITTGAMLDFVTALEAVLRSPYGGTVEVTNVMVGASDA